MVDYLKSRELLLELLQVDDGVDLAEHRDQLLLLHLEHRDLLDDLRPLPAVHLLLDNIRKNK